MKKDKYKIINSSGYVLLNQYEIAGEMVLGYGGVWGKDHRRAKKFDTMQQVRNEINRIPCRKGTSFLVVKTSEDWKKIYNKYKKDGRL